MMASQHTSCLKLTQSSPDTSSTRRCRVMVSHLNSLSLSSNSQVVVPYQHVHPFTFLSFKCVFNLQHVCPKFSTSGLTPPILGPISTLLLSPHPEEPRRSFLPIIHCCMCCFQLKGGIMSICCWVFFFIFIENSNRKE